MHWSSGGRARHRLRASNRALPETPQAGADGVRPTGAEDVEEIVGNDELATSLLRWMAKADFSQIAQLSELLKDDTEFLWAREH